MTNEVDQQEPSTIPDYLEKVFKQKEKDKLKRKMMGDDIDLKDKIKQYENEGVNVKYIDTDQFQKVVFSSLVCLLNELGFLLI